MTTFPIVVDVNPAGAIAGGAKVSRVLDDLQREARQLNEQLELVKFQSSRALSGTTLGSNATHTRAVNDGIKRQTDLLKGIRGSVIDYRENLGALFELHRTGAITANEYTKAVKDQARQFKIAQGGLRGYIAANKGAIAAAAAFVAIAGVKKIAQISDEYLNLQNRIRSVTQSEEELAQVTDRLFRVAQDTRQDFEGTVQVYARTATAITQLGFTTGEAIRFTERLNKTVAVSGANATEAKQAVIQLAQGLGSGTLKGEELNSVLEQLGPVADIIAKSLGVTRGELKKLAADGKITSGQLIGAFAQFDEEITANFEKSVPTIGQSFVQLQNLITQTVGELTTELGPAINKIVDAVQQTFQVAEPLIDAFADRLSGIGRSLEDAAEAGVRSFGAFLTILGETEQALNKINSLGGLAEDGGVLFSSALTQGKGAEIFLESPAAKFGDAQGELTAEAKKQFAELAAARDLAHAEEISAVQKARAVILAEQERAIKLGKKIREQETRDRIQAAEAAARAEIAAIRKRNDAFLELRKSLDPILAAEIELAEAEELVNSIIAAYPQLEEEAIRVLDQKRESLQDVLDPLGAYSLGIQDEIKLLSLSSTERARAIKLREAEVKLAAAGVEVNQSVRDSILEDIEALEDAERVGRRRDDQEGRREAILQSINGPMAEYRANIAATNELLAENEITQAQANAKIEEFQVALGTIELPGDKFRDFNGQVLVGFEKLKAEIVDTSSLVESAMTNAFSSAEDAFVDFVTTGKFDFRSMVDSMLGDLARLVARLTTTKAIGSLFPGGQFGAAAGGIPLLGFARGGAFQVGGSGGTDSQVVAFRATPGENVTVQPQGAQVIQAGGGSSAPPVVNVTNVVDPGAMVDVIRTPEGQRAWLEVARVNSGALRRMLRG